jgi:gamma-glutamyl phosphate reductase
MYASGSCVLHIFESGDVSGIKDQLDATSKILEETKADGQQTAKAQSMLIIENKELKSHLVTMEREIGSLKVQMETINRLMEVFKRLSPKKQAELFKEL